MDMDQTPLNKAHQLERKAEVLNRQKKLDECIQCHIEATELYEKCLQFQSNGDKNALESIQLQKEWNERQIRMIQLKKSYLEKTERNKKLNRLSSTKRQQKEPVEHIEAKIFKNFETYDSLIWNLEHRGKTEGPERDCQSIIEETEQEDSFPMIVGNKHPKDDSTVIEELKELSGKLRDDVQGLLIQLDDRNTEIKQLRMHIQNLELEKSYREGLSHAVFKSSTESSEKTSPLAVSCITDFSEEEEPELESLPQLETMAVPEIDLSTFKQFRMPKVNQKLTKKEGTY